MKYVNCPTCGSSAKFVSNNFERAEILVSAEHEYEKQRVDKLIKEIEFLQYIVDSNLKTISSIDLFWLFERKRRQELREAQTIIDEVYSIESEETKRLTKLMQDSFNKMLGDL